MICNTCQEDKPTHDFYRRSRNRDSFVTSCKKCVLKKNGARTVSNRDKSLWTTNSELQSLEEMLRGLNPLEKVRLLKMYKVGMSRRTEWGEIDPSELRVNVAHKLSVCQEMAL